MAKEYIEREALITQLNHRLDSLRAQYGYYDAYTDGFDEAVDRVEDTAPAADVVEVVRCKDCIYYEANCCFNSQWDMESSPEVPMVCENDFCSQGERKEQR